MATPPLRSRLSVLKTRKLFIGGAFPRSESGRVLPFHGADGEVIANYSHASRKDLRDAVAAARKALPGWSNTTAYLRSQILYRLAEMLESRADALVAELAATGGVTPEQATAEVAASIDRLVYTAGWPDKLSQVFGSVNPVAGPYFNVSTLDPAGVVVAFAPDSPALLAAITLAANSISVGNTCVLLASDRFPVISITLAEAIATSDLPGGVINILTGTRAELVPAAADHRDVDAILDATGHPESTTRLQTGASENLKRVLTLAADVDWLSNEAAAGPYRLLELTEVRTTWHPSGV